MTKRINGKLNLKCPYCDGTGKYGGVWKSSCDDCKGSGILKVYGKESIIDLHKCNEKLFDRKNLKKFFKELCDLLNMERCDLHFWDDVGVPESKRQTEPHLKGTSAIQFITTSNITIHTLNDLKSAYINIFSCNDFDIDKAEKFCKKFFKGKLKRSYWLWRN